MYIIDIIYYKTICMYIVRNILTIKEATYKKYVYRIY